MGSVRETKIGTQGNIKGSTKSSEGKQFSHLPSRGSYGNSIKRKSRGSSNSSGSGKGCQLSFLPKKPE